MFVVVFEEVNDFMLEASQGLANSEIIGSGFGGMASCVVPKHLFPETVSLASGDKGRGRGRSMNDINV